MMSFFYIFLYVRENLLSSERERERERFYVTGDVQVAIAQNNRVSPAVVGIITN